MPQKPIDRMHDKKRLTKRLAKWRAKNAEQLQTPQEKAKSPAKAKS